MKDYKTTVPGTQPQPEILRPNDLYIREYAQGVWIPLLQNFFGGLLGVGGFVALVAWKAGMTIEDALVLGAVVGGLVFCLATAFRAFRDEARQIIAAYGERRDHATRTALEAELTQLRKEMKELRSQGVISAQYQALMATERLLGDYFDRHLDITRAAAMQRGYSRPLWDSAMRLMRTAGVLGSKGELHAGSFVEAWARVLHVQSAGMGQFVVTENKDVIRQR